MEKIGKAKGGNWIELLSEFHLYLNQEAIKSAGTDVKKIGAILRDHFTNVSAKARRIEAVWVVEDILAERKVPAGELEKSPIER